MRMTLFAPKFGDLDLARKPILFLSPPSGGASLIGVTTTLVTLTSSAPKPPAKGLIRDGGISGYPIIIRGVAVAEGCPSHWGASRKARSRTAPANPLQIG